MEKKLKKTVANGAATNPGQIFQLKVTLKRIKPPIWRRILVPHDISLAKLHDVLQTVMGWTDSHLHEFIADGRSYGDPSFNRDMDQDVKNEKRYRLSQLVRNEKAKVSYVYDFGDYWEHELLLEKILPSEAVPACPLCLAGKRACPPEDCGGPSGYGELLESLLDPSHPDHEESFSWLPGDFDSEKFDIEAVNKNLRPTGTRPKRTWVTE
jgi:hypothetical protein